jgi:hypothetical protein
MEMERMPDKLPSARDSASGTEGDWSTLVGRAIDDVSHIIQSEVGLLETTVRAVVEEQTDYALANLAAVAVMICGAFCMLGALILLLHQWLQWWLALAIAGLVASAAGIAIHSAVGRRVAVRETRIKAPREK